MFYRTGMLCAVCFRKYMSFSNIDFEWFSVFLFANAFMGQWMHCAGGMIFFIYHASIQWWFYNIILERWHGHLNP